MHLRVPYYFSLVIGNLEIRIIGNFELNVFWEEILHLNNRLV